MDILFIIAIAQALFFCLILTVKKGRKILSRLLSLWLVLISFSLFLSYLYETGKIYHFPHLIGLDTAFPFLYMPISYFYTKLLVDPKKRLAAKDAFHLFPFLGYFIYVCFNFYAESAAYKLEFLQKLANSDFPLDIQLSNLLKIGLAFTYIFLIFRIIRRHQERIKFNFSYTESINLSWLYTINICLSVIYGLKFLASISIYFSPGSFMGKIGLLSDLAIILFVYIIAFFGVKQPNIFAKWELKPEKLQEDDTKTKPIEIVTAKKYQNSTLTKEETNQLLESLQAYMTQEKPFLQNKLTIKEVADRLEVNTKKLSQVINEQLGLNFFNYVNELRVEEVKNRIIDPEYDHLSLLGIAQDCGFNSKSTFNSVFKKQTGMTPTVYKSDKS